LALIGRENAMPKSARIVYACALAAGTVCAAEAESQTRAPVAHGAGATIQASATILPSLDAASFYGVPHELAPSAPRRALLATTSRVPEAPTRRPSLHVDSPVARSFEPFVDDGRHFLRHTIAVLY
jgi:hypothetical protein